MKELKEGDIVGAAGVVKVCFPSPHQTHLIWTHHIWTHPLVYWPEVGLVDYATINPFLLSHSPAECLRLMKGPLNARDCGGHECGM